jgi:hypothetical protein
MRYAQLIRVATETKNVKKVYAVNNINRFGRWSGAPGGYGAPISNSFSPGGPTDRPIRFDRPFFLMMYYNDYCLI